MPGAACGAAIKADGYGLGAREVMAHLHTAGCRDFFVATWNEAEALGALPDGAALSVLHGVRPQDMEIARRSAARPVLNTAAQVALWRQTGRPCDVMIDTGMNRLGLSAEDAESGLLDGLTIETLMSHLACADDDSPLNAAQLAAFSVLDIPAKRRSLANSAGICLGAGYGFDLIRPGLALYGGVPRAEAAGGIAQVVFPEAEVIQRRRVEGGESVGYGATFTATEPTEVAILNIGYADGYFRAFAGNGSAGGGRFPLLGRVSMDLIAVSVDADPSVGEGDWLSIDFNLPRASADTGIAQYELLTGLGSRFHRVWA